MFLEEVVCACMEASERYIPMGMLCLDSLVSTTVYKKFGWYCQLCLIYSFIRG